MNLNLSNIEVLTYLTSEYGLKKEECNCVELGVRSGHYSEAILNILKPANLYLVDAWKHLDDYIDSSNVSNERHEEKYQEVVNKFKNNLNVHIMRMLTTEAVSQFEDNYFDFIYIDANHAYKYVKKDIEDWYPKLKTNGIMSGDDYHLAWKGVIQAVDEFANKNLYQVHIAHKNNTWFFQKR